MYRPKRQTAAAIASSIKLSLFVGLLLSMTCLVGCMRSPFATAKPAATEKPATGEIDDFEIGKRLRRNNRSAGIGTGVDEKARDIEKNLGYR